MDLCWYDHLIGMILSESKRSKKKEGNQVPKTK